MTASDPVPAPDESVTTDRQCIEIPVAVWAAACDFCGVNDVRTWLNHIHIDAAHIEASDGRTAFRWEHVGGLDKDTDLLLKPIKLPGGTTGKVSLSMNRRNAVVHREPFRVNVSAPPEDLEITDNPALFPGGRRYPDLSKLVEKFAAEHEDAGKPCDLLQPVYVQKACKHIVSITKGVGSLYPSMKIVTNGNEKAAVITSPSFLMHGMTILIMPMRA